MFLKDMAHLSVSRLLSDIVDTIAGVISLRFLRGAKRVPALPVYTDAVSSPWGGATGVFDLSHGTAVSPSWGLALVNLDHLERKIHTLKRCIRADPANPEGYYLWGNALADLCRYDEAIQRYKQAIERDAHCTEAYYAWGKVLEKMGRPREAIDKYKKVVELDPQKASAYERWRGAIDKIETVQERVEELKKCSMAYYTWGISLDKSGRPYDAIEKYKKAVEIRPHYEAYHGWGVALNRVGRHAEAHYYWGIALSFWGQPHSAIEQFKKATEMKPRMAEAYYGWGFALGHLNCPEEAVEKFRTAMDINPYLPPPLPPPITGKRFQTDLQGLREQFSQSKESASRHSRPYIGIRNITGQDIHVSVTFEKVGEKGKKEKVTGIVEVGCQKLFIARSCARQIPSRETLYSARIRVSLDPGGKTPCEEAVQYIVSLS